MSVKGQQVSDVTRGVLELRVGERPRRPIRPRLLLGQSNAEHLLHQRLIAEREAEADQRGARSACRRSTAAARRSDERTPPDPHRRSGARARRWRRPAPRPVDRAMAAPPRRPARRRSRPRSGSGPTARSRCGCVRTRCRARASLRRRSRGWRLRAPRWWRSGGAGARARSGCRWARLLSAPGCPVRGVSLAGGEPRAPRLQGPGVTATVYATGVPAALLDSIPGRSQRRGPTRQAGPPWRNVHTMRVSSARRTIPLIILGGSDRKPADAASPGERPPSPLRLQGSRRPSRRALPHRAPGRPRALDRRLRSDLGGRPGDRLPAPGVVARRDRHRPRLRRQHPRGARDGDAQVSGARGRLHHLRHPAGSRGSRPAARRTSGPAARPTSGSRSS